MAITEPHTTPTEAALEVFWFFVTAAVALTAAIVVVAGPDVIAAAGARYAVVALLVLFAVHSWRQHVHRQELMMDVRARRDRERRGF